jgi:hypothetical protein
VLGFVWVTFLGTRILPSYNPPEDYAALDTLGRMGVVRDRIVGWLLVAQDGRQVAGEESGLVFVLATAILLWLLAYVCVRFLVRYVSFWGATLPSAQPGALAPLAHAL